MCPYRSFGEALRLGHIPPEQACHILRNTAEVCRVHYLRLQVEGVKVDAMTRFEQAYENACAATVQ